jgi:hypothetical protein
LLDRVAPKKAFLKDLKSTGGSAQVIVAFLGDGYLGDTIPEDMVGRLADLGLGFGIECFVVPQSK